jgi:HD superfamily phosphodiesterase
MKSDRQFAPLEIESERDIYQSLWDAARPYYEKGRPMDIAHIEWMMNDARYVCKQEGLDESLLLPLAILHDVGYSQVPDVASADYYEQDIRRLHMDEGAKIARVLLEKLNYPSDKTERIVHYISVHDNWAYDEVDIYMDDPILGTFKDLDYIWIYTKIGFGALKKVKGWNDKQMLEHLRNEPSPIYGKKPFSNATTKKLHDKYLAERVDEVQNEQ